MFTKIGKVKVAMLRNNPSDDGIRFCWQLAIAVTDNQMVQE
jgi:hypothetical protein